MLLKIFIGLTLVIVAFLVAVALQPDYCSITRAMTMPLPANALFAQVNDFHNWQTWSPWAKLDPACKVSFEGASFGKGAIFSWAGNNKVGAGRMTILESQPSELIRIKLEFFKPMPGLNDTLFTFKPEGNQTTVTWSMKGKRPFMAKAFCMFVNMDKMVGGDFEKGLTQMKAAAEIGLKK